MKTSRSPRHAFCDARRSKKPLEREVIEGVRWKEEASVRDLVIPERGTTSPSPKTLQAVTIIIVDDAVVAIVGIKGGTEFS